MLKTLGEHRPDQGCVAEASIACGGHMLSLHDLQCTRGLESALQQHP